jgi:hypothetical protein
VVGGPGGQPGTGAGAVVTFHPGQKPDDDRRNVQIAAKPRRRAHRKPKAKPKTKLTRVAFTVSRLMEFCTERELQNQTGHSVYEWPLVVLKELMDNSLDACEEAEVAPVISIAVRPGSFTIQDNGGGIKTPTIRSILDYNVRVSSREAYVSPTRGAQGNALKTILAMGYVLARRQGSASPAGVTIIETRGIRHRITFGVDHINNQPRITHTTEPSAIETGTKITVEWPPEWEWWDERWHIHALFKRMTKSYAWLNPHLTLRAMWLGKQFVNVKATNPHWQKWGPRDPTSAHWYDEARLQRHLAAHVARDRDLKRHRTVREFISEFRGLSRSAVQRKVLEEVGCSHQSLAQFFGVDEVNSKGIAKLLASMKKHTKPVSPKLLGIIGAEHFKRMFLAAGGNEKTFTYQQRKGETDEGIPYLIEVAFGLHGSGLNQGASVSRTFITGVNWSVGIHNPFRSFGSTGEGLESTLAKVRANASQPVICVAHLACARIQYADRGKSSIILDNAEQPDD